MGRDNQPKNRQKHRDLRRHAAKCGPFERLLIVCEDTKITPQYLEAIRQEYRLTTANVQIQPSTFGTHPLAVVNYAEHLFNTGDCGRPIPAKAFDRVIAVFDRDEHPSYHHALDKAAALNKSLINDDAQRIPFDTVASVPCFEVWLLLHFEDVPTPIHRHYLYERLADCIPGYSKASSSRLNLWAATRERLAAASTRAKQLAAVTNAHDGNQTYTDMACLVERLTCLRQPPEEYTYCAKW
jgi:hypothetical protein